MRKINTNYMIAPATQTGLRPAFIFISQCGNLSIIDKITKGTNLSVTQRTNVVKYRAETNQFLKFFIGIKILFREYCRN